MSDPFEVDPSLAGLVEAAAQAVQDDHRNKRQRTDDFNHALGGDITVEALPVGDQQDDDLFGDNDLDDEQRNEDPPNGTAASDDRHSSSDSRQIDSPNTAVLFRQTPDTARKYSRPPMAKLFKSSELVPENFLKLQNDGKAWMLDPAHLDRREVIGDKRERGGQDLARIRLFAVTEAYLEAGAGVRYFGHASVTEGYDRSAFWPEDSPDIIRFMMPLLRKMVANERQRVYAADTRRERARIAELGRVPPMPTMTTTVDPAAHMPAIPPSTQIMVNIGRVDEEGRFARLMPRFNISPDLCTTVAAVKDAAKSKATDPAITQAHPEMLNVNLDLGCTIKIWTQDGMLDIETDTDWVVALLTAENTDWMDGEVRLLVVV